jgi:hypothetical protein
MRLPSTIDETIDDELNNGPTARLIERAILAGSAGGLSYDGGNLLRNLRH